MPAVPAGTGAVTLETAPRGDGHGRQVGPDRSGAPTEPRPRLPHQPALDGLRGLAVAAVLLFHLRRLDGGFLGVDLFFVLSGFLITSLLVVEHQARGTVNLARFWARRARRLLPALVALVVGVAVLVALLTPEAQQARFRGEALSTLGYVANWHRLTIEIGYWDIFEEPSPLDHTWSLAIEEQFYVAWPLLAALVLGLGATWSLRRRPGGSARRAAETTQDRPSARRARHRRLGWVALGAAAVSFGLLAVQYSSVDTDRAYFGTDTRIGATLVGAALATFTAVRTNRAGWSWRRELVGWVGLAWLAWSVLFVDGLGAWYYQGGLVTFAVAAVVVIWAVTSRASTGPLARLLGWAPLRWLGLVSYGVYLWHWPIDVYLTEERAHLQGWVLDTARVGLTLVVAGLSYRLLEQPIRRGALPGWRLWAAGGVGALVAVGAVVGVTWGARPAVGGAANLSAHGFGPVPTEGSTNPYLLYPTPAELAPESTRVLLVGDSGAYHLGPILAEEGRAAGFTVASSAPYYCNIAVPEGVARFDDGVILDNGPCQDRRRALLRDLIDQFDPDAVVYYLANAGGPGKVRVDGQWVYDCEPAYERYLTEALRDEVDLLATRGARVVFATSPYTSILDEDADARVDCRNDLFRRVARSRPDRSAVVDMNAYVEEQVETSDVDMFMDIVHLSPDGSRLVSRWLLPQLPTLVAGP